MTALVEACVDAIDSAIAAEEGGASRIELCGELLQGGVTPSAGLISAVWERVNIPVFVLIRARPGDFLYSDDELNVMLRDIEIARNLDVEGIVIGALTRDGDVDVRAVSALVDAAGALNVTFHRAFDFVRDRSLALETLVELGIDRILTSGGAPTAIEGVQELKRLTEQAAGRITIVAGGGITAENASEIVKGAGVHEVHVRAAKQRESEMRFRPANITLSKPAVGEFQRIVTMASEMEQVTSSLNTYAAI